MCVWGTRQSAAPGECLARKRGWQHMRNLIGTTYLPHPRANLSQLIFQLRIFLPQSCDFVMSCYELVLKRQHIVFLLLTRLTRRFAITFLFDSEMHIFLVALPFWKLFYSRILLLLAARQCNNKLNNLRVWPARSYETFITTILPS